MPPPNANARTSSVKRGSLLMLMLTEETHSEIWVADAQELGGELQQAFDLTEQQLRRLEDFQDSVLRGCLINDLASVAVDHIFDSFHAIQHSEQPPRMARLSHEVPRRRIRAASKVTSLRLDKGRGRCRIFGSKDFIEDRDRRLSRNSGREQTNTRGTSVLPAIKARSRADLPSVSKI